MHRREFLTTAGTGLLAASQGFGMGRDAEVGIALLKHGSGFDQRPAAVEQLMWEVTKRTSIDVRERPGLVSPEDDDLFRWPFLVWVGDGACEPLSDGAVARLRRYLRAGGFLFIDDIGPGDAFDATARAEIQRLWPYGRLEPIDSDHTVYRTFFLLDRPYGRTARVDRLEGVRFDDRSPILYGRNDMLGAFGRDNLGRWHLPVVPGGSVQRERAFRMGINLLMYATCLNYKRDQVHTTAIMRRRKWRVGGSRPTR